MAFFDPLSFDPVSFDPLSFDPVSFDPGSFDPLSVNRGCKLYVECFVYSMEYEHSKESVPYHL